METTAVRVSLTLQKRQKILKTAYPLRAVNLLFGPRGGAKLRLQARVIRDKRFSFMIHFYSLLNSIDSGLEMPVVHL